LDLPRNGFLRELDLHPDGKRFAVTIDLASSDIWMLEGFRLPKTGWERLAFWK
jgi:hypothetical protein